MVKIISNIERIIVSRGISLNTMLEDLNIPASLFACWKRGRNRAKVTTLCKISNYLGVSLTDLLTDNPKRASIENQKQELLFNIYDFSAEEFSQIELYIRFLLFRRKTEAFDKKASKSN